MPNLCQCGCGRNVTTSSKFIYGHGKNFKPLCACGCGQLVRQGSKFAKGHRKARRLHTLTEEQRKHLSEINKGERNPAYGKPVPEELRKRRGESIKKSWADPEKREKWLEGVREGSKRFWADPEKVANRKTRSGPDHPMWKGGASERRRGPGWSNGARSRVNNPHLKQRA